MNDKLNNDLQDNIFDLLYDFTLDEKISLAKYLSGGFLKGAPDDKSLKFIRTVWDLDKFLLWTNQETLAREGLRQFYFRSRLTPEFSEVQNIVIFQTMNALIDDRTETEKLNGKLLALSEAQDIRWSMLKEEVKRSCSHNKDDDRDNTERFWNTVKVLKNFELL